MDVKFKQTYQGKVYLEIKGTQIELTHYQVMTMLPLLMYHGTEMGLIFEKDFSTESYEYGYGMKEAGELSKRINEIKESVGYAEILVACCGIDDMEIFQKACPREFEIYAKKKILERFSCKGFIECLRDNDFAMNTSLLDKVFDVYSKDMTSKEIEKIWNKVTKSASKEIERE